MTPEEIEKMLLGEIDQKAREVVKTRSEQNRDIDFSYTDIADIAGLSKSTAEAKKQIEEDNVGGGIDPFAVEIFLKQQEREYGVSDANKAVKQAEEESRKAEESVEKTKEEPEETTPMDVQNETDQVELDHNESEVVPDLSGNSSEEPSAEKEPEYRLEIETDDDDFDPGSANIESERGRIARMMEEANSKKESLDDQQEEKGNDSFFDLDDDEDFSESEEEFVHESNMEELPDLDDAPGESIGGIDEDKLDQFIDENEE